MADDCCGGGGPAWPGPAPTVWPPVNWTGTIHYLPDAEAPSMQWEGIDDASTILGGAPAFTPPDNPALVSIVEIRNKRERLHHGFPNGCFATPANCHQAFDLAVPENWRYHAKMLELSYGDNPFAGKYLQTFCPCLNTGLWTPNSDSPVPGTMIAHTNEWTIIYISGTSTFQQRALQGASSLLGPSAGDGYGTLLFWYNSFTSIVNRIIASGIPIRPNWFIAGHSYGAVVAAILAANVKRAVPARNVNLFTLGAPCPGDDRLIDLLEEVDQVNLQNTGDIVCSTPPSGGLLDNVWWLLPDAFRLSWPSWRPLRRRVNIDPLGVRTNVNEGAIEFDALSTLVNAIVTGADIAECVQHRASVYYARASIVE